MTLYRAVQCGHTVEPDRREARYGLVNVYRLQGRHEEAGTQLGLHQQSDPKTRPRHPDPRLDAMDPIKAASAQNDFNDGHALQEIGDLERARRLRTSSRHRSRLCAGTATSSRFIAESGTASKLPCTPTCLPWCIGNSGMGNALPTMGSPSCAIRARGQEDLAARIGSDFSPSGRAGSDIGPSLFSGLQGKSRSVRGDGFDKHRHAFRSGDSHGLACLDRR